MCRSSTPVVLAGLPVSCTLSHCFLLLAIFPRFTNPGVYLCVGHQHPYFFAVLTRFVDYFSLFCAPPIISTIDKPRGAFMCRSSTPVVLAGSNPFRGLLLTVLGSQRDFHDR